MTKLQKLRECFSGKNDGTYISEVEPLLFDKLRSAIGASVSRQDAFPNIFAALKILGTIPVTSCECERTISVLRRLKTYLRSSMTQERLNGLAMMSIHRNHPFDVDRVINLFAAKHPRKMVLIDLLDSDE